MFAALDLFASKGYESTTTREIAATAGCAEGLIHRYFNGKAGLLTALVEHSTAKDTPDARPGPRPARNLANELLQLVDHEVECMWESRDFLRVFLSRAIVDPRMGKVINKALLNARTKTILDRLQKHGLSEHFGPDVIEALAQSVGVLGLVFGFVRPALLGQNRAEAKKTATAVARILAKSPGRVLAN